MNFIKKENATMGGERSRWLYRVVAVCLLTLIGHPTIKLLATPTTGGVIPSPTSIYEKSTQPATVTVTGTVVDTNDEPIVGATLSVKGMPGKGTVTDIDGNFRLPDIAPNSTIIVSFIGMASQEIPLNGRKELIIQLREDQELLDELVVIGYGTQRKVDVIGSIAQVEGEDLSKKTNANLENALTGMMAGVTIRQNSGAPGAENNIIRIRGVGSFGANASPLVLIDGIPGSLADVHSNDVESISVLKDASTAAIYGSRAANGVILVSTKKGKSGKVNVSYSGYYGINSVTALPQFVPTWEYAELFNEATGTPTYSEAEVQKLRDGSDPDNYANENYLEQLIGGVAPRTNHHLGVSGTVDNVTYYLSVGGLFQDGLVEKNAYTKYDTRLNLSIDILENLSLSANLHGLLSDRQEPNTPAGEDVSGVNYIIQKALRFPGVKPSKNSKGEFGVGPQQLGTPPAWLETKSFFENKRFRGQGNLSLNYKPISQITLTALAGITHVNGEQKTFRATMPLENGVTLGPSQLKTEMWRDFYRTFQSTASYNDKIGKSDFSFLLGYSYEDYRSTGVIGERDNLASNDLPYLNVGSPDNQKGYGGGYEWALQSIFGRANYNYADKYLLNLTARYDGSSRFPPKYRYAFFPSVATGWRVSEEQFFKDWSGSKWFSMLKLKASYGVLGNQNIGNYPWQTVYALGQDYPFGNNIQQGAAVTTATDENLTWESTRTWDVGFEATFWNGVLRFNANYFNRTTYDILFKPTGSVSTVSGLKVSPINTGILTNRGFEFELGHSYQVGDFAWNLNANLSIIKNEILSLGVGDVEQLNGLVGSGTLFIGYPINVYYGYKTNGVFMDENDIKSWADQKTLNPNSQIGDIRYMDISGPEGVPDGKVDADYDRTILGSSLPKYTFSINTDLVWRDFDLSLQLQGIAGVNGYLSNFAGYAFYQEGNIQRWQADGRFRVESPERYPAYPRLEYIPNTGTSNTLTSDFWMLDASYLRVKNLQLGYNIPETLIRKLHLSSLRLYLSGENLWTFSKYPSGWDPEINTSGVYYPIQRTISVGINISL